LGVIFGVLAALLALATGGYLAWRTLGPGARAPKVHPLVAAARAPTEQTQGTEEAKVSEPSDCRIAGRALAGSPLVPLQGQPMALAPLPGLAPPRGRSREASNEAHAFGSYFGRPLSTVAPFGAQVTSLGALGAGVAPAAQRTTTL
jgi:hypothetical protein